MVMENLQTLNNFMKTQYIDQGLPTVLPDNTFLMSTVPMVKDKEKAGHELIFAISVGREHGFTPLGQQGQNSALRQATVAASRQARVISYGIGGRTQIDQLSISRAVGSEQSFVRALEYKIQNLQESFALMIEQELMYGQSGLATIASGTEADATVGGVVFTDGVNVASKAIKIASKEFADHIWLGSESMPVDIYDASGVFVYSTDVTSYSTESEYITLASLNGLVDMQGYKIFRAGFKDNSGPGLQKILTSTSSTLFGIDQASTPLWKASQYDCGNDFLSFPKIAEGVSRAVGRGLSQSLSLHVHPEVFASLMPDFNTVKATGADFKSRVFMSSSEVKKLEHGSMGIKFIIGAIEVTLIANPFIKKGYAFGIADGELKRAGSSDISYDMPGEIGGKDNYFHRLDNSLALEMRVFSDQALFSMTLNKHICFSNIKARAY